MASSEKRCLYEVLGIPRDCTPDEIRSAYRKLALQRHPDKLVKSGVPESEATAFFQELVNAYEVLSDPRERAWYDSHRSQILFSDHKSSSGSSSVVPDLFSFFSNSVFSGYSDKGKGFFRVYADVFDKILANELNFAKKLGLGLGSVKEAPVMGNLESPYTQVTAFYSYWLGFSTVMDFCWADQYDVMAGPNRKSRRLMEDENKKLRKKARREYNETVRGLAEFVKKRDKRVIDMQVKRNEEMERKREVERERKKELEREKMRKARAYEEPDWAKIDEDEMIEHEFIDEAEDEKKKGEVKELYCVVCSKKFKSEKQWKNHEQSKKHKEKVAELKAAFGDEEEEEEEEEELEEEEVLGGENGVDGDDFASVNNNVDDLEDDFEKRFGIEERNSDNNEEGEAQTSEEEEGFDDIGNNGGSKGFAVSLGSDEDEISILETLVSGSKNKRNGNKGKVTATEAYVEDDSDEMGSMAYNNRKTRKNKGARRGRSKKTEEEEEEEEATKAEIAEINGQVEESNGHGDDDLHKEEKEEEPSQSLVENEINGRGDVPLARKQKGSKPPVDKKATPKRDTDNKSKNSSKSRKQKATSKNSGNFCDTCGEEFESRTKLHKHLVDKGHAKLKSR